ncbi:Replicative DNA helicase [Candidatus Xenohaliotis californiensis]|uniref:Replicative DNA helicase n=1 Tax=Candidatus Xenohaliotis californiensis TaxID=84677 RepID=A0ABM9N796_9RICK|nr:Replicative DNA helicase [Candidatus Xenohaliotis californiensis]
MGSNTTILPKTNKGGQETTTKQSSLYDVRAEQLLLGALLYNNENIDGVMELIEPNHFYTEFHQRLYSQITEMHNMGLEISPISLKLFIKNDEAHKQNPDAGIQHLIRLVNESTATMLINIKQLSHSIKNLFLMRSVESTCRKAISNIQDENDSNNIINHIEDLEKNLFELGSGKSDTIYKSTELINKSIEKIKINANKKHSTTGLSTGFIDLDSLLDGLHNSDLIILAARPSMGKTALAINIAVNIANKLKQKALDDSNKIKEHVVFISLEMSAEQLMTRILAMQAEINIHSIRRGTLTEEQLFTIEQLGKQNMNLPLIIDDSSAMNMSTLRARLRRLKRKENITCVFIDYLQLLKNKSDNTANRAQEVAEITQKLKSLAKELDMPVVALSQLSRAVELRDDKQPQLSDLRESGSIEQDADIVMFLYRDAYYEERKKPEESSAKFMEWQEKMESIMNQADIIIAKHRNGPIGFRRLFFDRNTTLFRNYQKN